MKILILHSCFLALQLVFFGIGISKKITFLIVWSGIFMVHELFWVLYYLQKIQL